MHNFKYNFKKMRRKDLISEINRLHEYATRLLEDDGRLWRCKECNTEWWGPTIYPTVGDIFHPDLTCDCGAKLVPMSFIRDERIQELEGENRVLRTALYSKQEKDKNEK